MANNQYNPQCLIFRLVMFKGCCNSDYGVLGFQIIILVRWNKNIICTIFSAASFPLFLKSEVV